MGTDDKVENVADNVKGKAKEVTGQVTNDPDLEAEGKGEQALSDLKQAVEEVKDAAKT